MMARCIFVALLFARASFAGPCRHQCLAGEQRDEMGCCIGLAPAEAIKPDKALVRTAWKVKLLKLSHGGERGEIRPISVSKSRVRRWEGSEAKEDSLDEGTPILVFREGGKVDIVGPRPGSLSMYGALDADRWSVIPIPATLVLTVRNQPLFGSASSQTEDLHYALKQVTRDAIVIGTRVGEYTVEVTLIPATSADMAALNHDGPAEDKSAKPADQGKGIRVVTTLPSLSGGPIPPYCVMGDGQFGHDGSYEVYGFCHSNLEACKKDTPEGVKCKTPKGFWCWLSFEREGDRESVSPGKCWLKEAPCEKSRARFGAAAPNQYRVAVSDRCFFLVPAPNPNLP